MKILPKIVFMFVFVFCLFFVSNIKINAEEKEVDINVEFYVDKTAHHFKINFDDSYFFNPSTIYNHTLAQYSMCMAFSSSRPYNRNVDYVKAEESNIVGFFENCGFSNIKTDDYDKVPTLYTVGTAIASKQIKKDGEEYTLVAVAICGGNYKKEWLSNLTLDSETNHKGFDEASNIVTDRILGYLGINHIKSNIKIWVSGFSRAAAIANVTAAKITDTEITTKDNIFGYTFATPRATVSEASIEYTNIHNVIGPSDAVAQVVPGEWGYRHYGIDHFLPSAETNSHFDYLYSRLQEKYAEVGLKTYYIPGLNLRVRLLIGILLELINTPLEYSKTLQPAAIKILEDRTLSNVFITIQKLLSEWKRDNKEKLFSKDDLINYLIELIPSVLLKNGFLKGQVSSGTFGAILMHEHLPDIYFLWMMYFTEEELFNNYEYSQNIIIKGNAETNIYDNKTNELLFTVDNKGNVKKSNVAVEKKLSLHADLFKNQVLIYVPSDIDYRVDVKALEKGNINVATIPTGIDFVPEYVDFEQNLNLDKNEVKTIFEVKDGFSQFQGEAGMIKASDLAERLNIERRTFSWRTILLFRITCVLLLIDLFVFLIIFILRKIKNKKFPWLNFIIISLIAIFTINSEVANWLLTDTPSIRISLKIGIFIAFLAIFFHSRSIDKNFFKTTIPIIILAEISDILYSFSNLAGLIFLLAAHGYLIYYLLRTKKLNKQEWLGYALITVFTMPIVLYLCRHLGADKYYFLIAYPILTLALALATKQRLKIRIATDLLVLSDVFIAIYIVYPNLIINHLLSNFIFYLALLLFVHSENYDLHIDFGSLDDNFSDENKFSKEDQTSFENKSSLDDNDSTPDKKIEMAGE